MEIRTHAQVALESAVITHGLPRPHNLDTARAMQHAVRESGATPRFVALLSGTPCVGMSEAELEWLAEYPAPSKIALHNLGLARAMRLTGGTTVAATVHLAHQAGITVTATGGIGGVHRDGRDISSDLPTLARTPILVVCSGVKAVLDMPATREWLETHGIPIVGYGTEEMPGFYTALTGLRVDVAVYDVESLLALWRAHRALGTAMVVVQPPPDEDALSPAELDAMLQQAIAECAATGVSGAATTPWLLARLAELSDGRTLAVNRALLEANARLAGAIAQALALS